MIDLSGRVALVTGASRGIGRACALKLAAAGADVVVNYLTSQSAAKDVAEQVRQLGRRSATVKADVSEEEDVRTMIGFVGDHFERLDILVSNAAAGGFRPLMESTPRHFDAAMHTNTRALIVLVQAARHLLQKSPYQGKVVALSSHGSHRALPNYALVGASKAALESLVRHLALELGREGINFNIVLSGLVETESTRRLPGAEEMFRLTRERLLVPDRELQVEDVANTVLFLASSLSDLVQGETLTVDGGLGIRA